jgi:hypothetical protein
MAESRSATTSALSQGSAYDYRLIGIQSAWDNRENVAMCAAQPFIRALAQMIKGRQDSQGGEG